MTLQKSSADKKAAAYDFKRSFYRLLPPTVISLLVFLFYFAYFPALFIKDLIASIATVTTNSIGGISQLRKSYCLMLVSDIFSNEYIIIPITAVIVGVIFAFWAFLPIMRKNSVNFYFSNAVNRRCFFRNRASAAVILMLASSLLPLLIDIAVNIHYFGHAEYVIYQGFLLFAENFTYLLVGFSFMSLAMAMSFTVTESLFLGASLLWLPTIVSVTLEYLASSFLRGYELSNSSLIAGFEAETGIFSKLTIINPLFFGSGFGLSANKNLYLFCMRTLSNALDNTDYTASDTLFYGTFSYISYDRVKAGFEYIAPIIIWLAVSALVLFASQKLIEKRKCEKTAIHSSSMFVSSFIAGAFAALAVMCFAIVNIESNKISGLPAHILIGCFIVFAVYYITLSIFRRSVRHNMRFVIAPVLCALFLFAGTTVFSSDIFGYSDYVPDISSIEYATISCGSTDPSGYMSDASIDGDPEYEIFGSFTDTYHYLSIFSNEESINKIAEIQKSVAATPGDENGQPIRIVYCLKNGSYVSRYFSSCDISVDGKVLDLTLTDEFKDELDYILSPDRKKEENRSLANDSTSQGYVFIQFNNETEAKEHYKHAKATVISNDFHTKTEIENTDELRRALVTDINSIGLKNLFMSGEKPLGAIQFSGSYYVLDESGNAASTEGSYQTYTSFYIFESMTETVNYLKSIGAYDCLSENNTGNITEAYVISVNDFLKTSNRELSAISKFFRVFIVNDDEYKETWGQSFTKSETYKIFTKKGTKVADKSMLDELSADSYIFSPMTKDGIIVLMKTDKNYFVAKYLPSDKIAKYQKQS